MTNVLIETLARLVQRYFDDLKSGGVECRLVLPALTEEIAIGLQEALVSVDLPSYLVVPRSQSTDPTKRWMRAEGITSVRQGDMIVIVWPGEMSRIQDSVIGAGGAMRNFAFSDEWPWIEASNEYFRFEGPVLTDILANWGIQDECCADTYSTILCAARETCRDSLLRGIVFLDYMLGSFDPKAHASINNEIERLLFHLGIPLQENVIWAEKGAAKRFFSDVRRVVKELGMRVRDADGKQELLSRIPDIEPDEQIVLRLRNSFTKIVDSFTTRGDDRQEGLLALHGCWGTADVWDDWSLLRLQALLDVVPTEEDVNITAQIGVSSGVVAEDGKSVVLIEGGFVQIIVNYEGLAADSTDTEIRILDRAKPLFREACTGTSGQLQVDLYHDHLFGTGAAGKKKSLRIIAIRGQKELATARLTIIPCGPNQPLVAIIEPGFKYYLGNPTAQGADQSDEVEKIEVNEPARFTVVSWEGFDDGEAEIDDESIDLEKDVENSRIFRVSNAVDPGTSGTGRSSIFLRVSGLEIAVDVEAKNILRGEFTLERELIVQLAAMSQAPGHRAAVKRIVEIFTGEKTEPYLGLGGLDDSSHSRVRLAKFFEADFHGRPIITDLLEQQSRAADPLDSKFAQCDREFLPAAFQGATIRPEVEELIGGYLSLLHMPKANMQVACGGAR